ncbi:MAG TPA: 50S ribosomal protein L35 [Moorella mulderi]|nr:50S ribosomal protein L35 [Moorella mulderi]
MPKMKTHSGASKRFRYTATGKIRRYRAYKSHLLEGKSAKRKRRLRQPALVHDSNYRQVARLLPYK